MRVAGVLAALGFAALLLLAETGSARPVWAAGLATSRSAQGPPHAKSYQCLLPVGPGWRLGAGNRPAGSRSGPPARPGTNSGNLAVTIPPVVVVRAQGRWLLVTTNTGEPPNPWEQIYEVAHGNAVTAGPGLRRQVLSECTGHSHR